MSNNGASRYARLGDAPRAQVKATWEDADADQLWRAIYEVTNTGDALMFSLTRDGGAVVLTVLAGDERVRQYATGEEEIAKLLTLVREAATPE